MSRKAEEQYTSDWVAKQYPNNAVSIKRRTPSIVPPPADARELNEGSGAWLSGSSCESEGTAHSAGGSAPTLIAPAPRIWSWGRRGSVGSEPGAGDAGSRGRRASWAFSGDGDGAESACEGTGIHPDYGGGDSPSGSVRDKLVSLRGSVSRGLGKGYEKLASLSHSQVQGGNRQRRLEAMSDSLAEIEGRRGMR